MRTSYSCGAEGYKQCECFFLLLIKYILIENKMYNTYSDCKECIFLNKDDGDEPGLGLKILLQLALFETK